ncbi:S41 family peptidase [Devosia soli]|uniref:S41 family peptidase n=1 Tax=Devosia soli TaxID=361041 RepID=UPI003CC79FBD
MVTVPACILSSQSEAEAFANTIAEHIQNLARSKPTGWIIDLRQNFGGNMWPMLAGLYPLLGPGMVGAFIDREGRRQNWILSWGAASVGDQVRCAIKAEATAHQQSGRIAVLTDRTTASSGEAIATAFRCWPRSRSFGDCTAGASTSNSSFQMPDGCILALTTGVFMDRGGGTYGGPLIPDERVDPQRGDDTVERASAWIMYQRDIPS